MKKILLRLSFFIFSFFAFMILINFIHLPIPAQLDFQVLYNANFSLLQGVPLYDRAAQAAVIAHSAGVSPDVVTILPFPYPPWYALSTFFLALFPSEIAVRLWFGLNLSMLMISVWLLTDGWPPRKRLVSFLAAILFVPILGSLYVGQYIFPVLLGAALLVFSLRHENVPLTALAAALLMFKPHLGGLIALAAVIYLFLRRDEFSKRALASIFIAGIILFGLGFLADPAWPVNYLHSLLDFRNIPGVSSCGLCASLPVALTALIIGETNIGLAFLIGAALLITLIAILFFFNRDIFRKPESLIGTVVLIVLLADPYLLNYDSALLLIPLFLLAAPVRRIDWLFLLAVYFLPLIVFGAFARAGSLYLPLAQLILLPYQIVRTRSIDVSSREA